MTLLKEIGIILSIAWFMYLVFNAIKSIHNDNKFKVNKESEKQVNWCNNYNEYVDDLDPQEYDIECNMDCDNCDSCFVDTIISTKAVL